MKDEEAEGGLVKILQPQEGIEGNLEGRWFYSHRSHPEKEWPMANRGQGEIPGSTTLLSTTLLSSRAQVNERIHRALSAQEPVTGESQVQGQ